MDLVHDLISLLCRLPDYVVKGPAYDVPAKGVLEWTNVVVPSGFTKDTWITSLEIKPSALAVTHHICVSFIAHTPEVKYGVPVWVDKQRDESGSALPRAKGVKNELPGVPGVAKDERELIGARFNPGGVDACYVPGLQVTDYRAFHAAKLIPANTDIVFQLHYTTTGTPMTDRPGLLGGSTACPRPFSSMAPAAFATSMSPRSPKPISTRPFSRSSPGSANDLAVIARSA